MATAEVTAAGAMAGAPGTRSVDHMREVVIVTAVAVGLEAREAAAAAVAAGAVTATTATTTAAGRRTAATATEDLTTSTAEAAAEGMYLLRLIFWTFFSNKNKV